MIKKMVLFCLAGLMVASVFAGASLATGSGDIPVQAPALTLGYTDQNFLFKAFSGTVGFFNVAATNLSAADQTVAVVANILNGATPATKASVVAGTKMAVLNHAPTFALTPGNSTSPFPSIWVKGTVVNPATATSEMPATYISGTDANKYYQQGLTVQAPYWDEPDYQWTLYVYADKDILSQKTGPTTGRILDPRVSTMRWFAWTANASGEAKDTWGVRAPGATTATMFNTMPLTTGTPAEIKAFLAVNTTGVSTPETATGLSAIGGVAQASIPANGNVYYNIDRNTVSASNANGFSITGRSQTGLIYASPSDLTSHRTENLHMQFMAIWPTTIGLPTGPKTCDINLYQRTAN